MNTEGFTMEEFPHIFPHMENILQFGAYVVDLKTNTMKWSKGLYQLMGVEPFGIEVKTDTFYKYIVDSDVEYVKTSIQQALEQKTPYRLEFSIVTEKDILKRVYAEIFVKFNDNGEMIAYSGIMKDITENYSFKKALEQKIEQLDKSNHNLQEFVYVASHDLQEPLRKISTFAERLNTKYNNSLEKEGQMYINRIVNSIRSMQTLLEDLLDFSKLSFQSKQFEKVSIQECIERVMSDLEIKIEESKTIVNCSNLDDVEAYPSQITQLFNNLISNAIKFKKSQETPIIEISCDKITAVDYPNLPLSKNTTYVKIHVKDNGIGFDQEFSERIFMIFQRLHGKAEYQGSGIGLSICKKIVDNHHGFIFAEGWVNKGATFTILLPKQQS